MSTVDLVKAFTEVLRVSNEQTQESNAQQAETVEALRERLARVVRFAKVQDAILSSIYVQFGKKNMHLIGEWEAASNAIQPGDLE